MQLGYLIIDKRANIVCRRGVGFGVVWAFFFFFPLPIFAHTPSLARTCDPVYLSWGRKEAAPMAAPLVDRWEGAARGMCGIWDQVLLPGLEEMILLK